MEESVKQLYLEKTTSEIQSLISGLETNEVITVMAGVLKGDYDVVPVYLVALFLQGVNATKGVIALQKDGGVNFTVRNK